MARLTEQDRAVFGPIDRLVPGSILSAYAQSMIDRVEKGTLSLVGSRLNKVLYELAGFRDEFSWEDHDTEHEAATPEVIEQCTACRIQTYIDWIMEATVPR